MRILAIETSCDETSVAVVEAVGGFPAPCFSVLSNIVSSQTALHAHWGGVVPNLARREHERNLPIVLTSALRKGKLSISYSKLLNSCKIPNNKLRKVRKYLEREPTLLKAFEKEIIPRSPPNIDAVAVTIGPGLEPALWVGINFARALSALWEKPLIATNHMEGHIVAVMLKQKNKVKFPALALLVSGGHTELVLITNWLKYKVIGETRDDAAGETFDKVARMLGLPYPGGPEIARLAEKGNANAINFPRPMINASSFDFSFSGLKTSVLYYLRDHKRANKKDVAASFQQAAVEVLVTKTMRAVKEYKVKSIILGGGVAANDKLRDELRKKLKTEGLKRVLFLPEKKLTTDNAAMIAGAAYFHALKKDFANTERLRANANMSL